MTDLPPPARAPMTATPRTPRRTVLFALLGLVALVLAAGIPALLRDEPDRETDLERALLVTATAAELNARALVTDSTSRMLMDWCADRHLSDTPVLTTEHVHVPLLPIADPHRELLRVTPADAVGVQRTRHTCGGHVITEVETRYVVARLTEPMREVLRDSPRKPFDLIISELKPQRHVLAAETLWLPLPHDWAARSTPDLRRHLADHGYTRPAADQPLFRHELLTTGRDGVPLALSTETYRAALIERGSR